MLKIVNNIERFAVTPCNDNVSMSWGGSENNRWFQLNVSISMLCPSSIEKNHYDLKFKHFISLQAPTHNCRENVFCL